MRSLEFGLQLIFSVFKNFSKTFPEYIRMENRSCKIAWNHSKTYLNCFKKNLWIYMDGKSKLQKRKYWEKIPKQYVKKQVLKVKNSHLELEKDFIELKDRESKDIEIKIK